MHSFNKENRRTASVRFRDDVLPPSPPNMDAPAFNAAPSFLRELEDSKSYMETDVHAQCVAEEEHYDVPERLTKNMGIQNAVADLQRFSIHVGQQIRQSQPCGGGGGGGDGGEEAAPESRLEGQLYVRGRGIFSRWKKTYASVAVHNYFGPVLFLFSYDDVGRICIRDSVMIVLFDAHVRSAKQVKSHFIFRIKTDRRKWLFACMDGTRRDYWVEQIKKLMMEGC